MPFKKNRMRKCASEQLHAQLGIVLSDEANLTLEHCSRVHTAIKRKADDLLGGIQAPKKSATDIYYCCSCIDKLGESLDLAPDSAINSTPPVPAITPPVHASTPPVHASTLPVHASTPPVHAPVDVVHDGLYSENLYGVTKIDAQTQTSNVIIDINDIDLSSLAKEDKARLLNRIVLSEWPELYDSTAEYQTKSLQRLKNLHNDMTVPVLIAAFLYGLARKLYPSCSSNPDPLSYRYKKCAESCLSLCNSTAIFPYSFREALLIYTMTRSRLAVSILAGSTPCGTYPSLKAWLQTLSCSQAFIPKCSSDLLAVYDNNQTLQRRWNISLNNIVRSNVVTIVVYFEIDQTGVVQFNSKFKPIIWKWKTTPDTAQTVKHLEDSPRLKQCRYEKHVHPFISSILKQVAEEQKKQSDGAYKDEIDELVQKMEKAKVHKTCFSCGNTEVPKMARLCPRCKQKVTKSNPECTSGITDSGTTEKPTSSKEKPEVRIYFEMKNDDSYVMKLDKCTVLQSDEYHHLTEVHPKNPPKEIVGQPIFVNPCSYDAIATVLRKLGNNTGVEKYGTGTRQWLAVESDGLPFVLGSRVVENTMQCAICKESIFGVDAANAHSKKYHPTAHVTYTKEFDWVLLQPGPGHIEMQMVKAFVKLSWEIFWEDMVELFNFKSPNAKASALKVNDHHKGWTLCRIARESWTRELVIPYVRKVLAGDGEKVLSCAGFFKFLMNEVNDPNFGFMADLILELLDAIFLYRAGLRSGATDMMLAGRASFSKVWFGRCHSMYRELDMYDSIMRECMPAELIGFIDKTMSINLSGIPFSGEGADFKLENVNKGIQHMLPPVPSPRDWEGACANYQDLKDTREACLCDIGITDKYEQTKAAPQITEQVRAMRVFIRSKGYLKHPLEFRPHVTLQGVPLDKELIAFCGLAKKKRQAFCDALLEHYCAPIPKTIALSFKERPICITATEREEQNKIGNKTIKEIACNIVLLMSKISDPDMRETLEADYDSSVLHKKGKRAIKEDYITFHQLIEEYLDFETSGDFLPEQPNDP